MKKTSQQGFAMIEVLVTAVIVAIGISGMGILLMRAIQGTQDSAQQSQAMWIVQDFVGRIRANSDGARRGDYVINGAENCDAPPAAICADYNTSATKVNSAICNSNQMSTFDRWISVCGMTSNTGANANSKVFDSPAEFVVNPVLTSTCTNTSTRVSTSSGQPDCIQYDVKLTWQTRIAKSSADAAERINENTYSMLLELN